MVSASISGGLGFNICLVRKIIFSSWPAKFSQLAKFRGKMWPFFDQMTYSINIMIIFAMSESKRARAREFHEGGSFRLAVPLVRGKDLNEPHNYRKT